MEVADENVGAAPDFEGAHEGKLESGETHPAQAFENVRVVQGGPCALNPRNDLRRFELLR